jgi:hypothetical protein
MVNDIRVLTDQSGFHEINQGFLAKGLAQEPDRTSRQRLGTRRLISKTRNKYCWRRETLLGVKRTSAGVDPVQLDP